MVEERGTNYEGWGVKGKRIYEEGSIHSSSFPPLSFTFYLKGFLGSAFCIRILQAFSRYQKQLEINLKFNFFPPPCPPFTLIIFVSSFICHKLIWGRSFGMWPLFFGK